MPNPPRVLIIGASSSIAHAVARLYAADGARLVLVARRASALESNAADLRVRGAQAVETLQLDLDRTAEQAAMLETAFALHGGFDVALIAHGTLPDQRACEASLEATLASFQTNAVSAIALLTLLAERFDRQGTGVIGAISSPAAQRGRQSNYVYGAAKSAVSTFAAGLRHRLYPRVRVVTILPGFVDTPMTASFEKGALWASPERVAADIHRALARRNGVVYTPFFWRAIMLVIRALPDALFLRSKL